jgi:hypothetical protein
MDRQPRLVSVNTRLFCEALGLDIELRLRELDGRWLAVADFDGQPEVGIGASPLCCSRSPGRNRHSRSRPPARCGHSAPRSHDVWHLTLRRLGAEAWRMDVVRPMTHAELMALFGIGQDAVVLRDIVEPVARGPRHQPRIAAGTRVRIRGLVHEAGEPVYQVETRDDRGASSGWLALVAEGNLADAPSWASSTGFALG